MMWTRGSVNYRYFVPSVTVVCRFSRVALRYLASPNDAPSSATTPSEGISFLYIARTLINNEMNYKKDIPSEGVVADEGTKQR